MYDPFYVQYNVICGWHGIVYGARCCVWGAVLHDVRNGLVNRAPTSYGHVIMYLHMWIMCAVYVGNRATTL